MSHGLSDPETATSSNAMGLRRWQLARDPPPRIWGVLIIPLLGPVDSNLHLPEALNINLRGGNGRS